MALYIPSAGEGIDSTASLYQSNPLLQSYSPRLFGAPPQMTNLCDMRIKTRKSDGSPGEVGDYYLNHILEDAQIAYFVVGRAKFTGGKASLTDAARIVANYTAAYNKYQESNMLTSTPTDISTGQETSGFHKVTVEELAQNAQEMQAYFNSLEIDGAYDGTYAQDAEGLYTNMDDVTAVCDDAVSLFGTAVSALKTSLTAEQPMYTFDSDWSTYIDRVKMMINTAIIMLGLQDACVLENGVYLPINPALKINSATDVWSNYRFITPTTGLGEALEADHQNGDTSQYLAFMIEPTTATESFTNTFGESKLYSAAKAGSDIGSEIAWMSGTATSNISDDMIDLAGDVVGITEQIMGYLSGGVGRFTAAIGGATARSYMGQHFIFPKIHQESSGPGENMQISVKLTASGGDLYSQLMDILVPLFFILGMGIPGMSQNNASAYAYPPLVQCNIPGLWGTRLGAIQQLQIQKEGASIHGFPLSLKITLTVEELSNHLVASGMKRPAEFLNNHSMFDYIAQRCGVDKYRPNGTIRLIARAALATSQLNSMFYHLNSALLSDYANIENKMFGKSRF